MADMTIEETVKYFISKTVKAIGGGWRQTTIVL